jgi:aryl-alcohol dehydrogenase-like predicted oxidoreductase
MQLRQLGSHGPALSAIGFGAWEAGGEGWGTNPDDTEVIGAIHAAIDAGINWIDTAEIYGDGVSETLVGRALEDRRDQMYIATKVAPHGDGTGHAPEQVRAACDASLRRLRTDVIDLYQVHQWDGQTPLEETLEALDGLVRQGKVRYVGCSNYSGWHIMKAMEIARRDGRIPFVSQQIHYTLEAREAEYELVPITIDQGLGILVWSPIAGGLLSGKHRRDRQLPEGTRQLAGWPEPPIRDENRLWNIVDALVAIGEARGVSAAQVALAWLIGRPGVTSVIIGGRTEEQFRDNLAAADLVLTPEERKRLDDVSKPPLLYPYWHQAGTAKDRLGAADLAFLAPYIGA